MKKLFLALVLACAAFSVHALDFNFFDYADCVKDAKAVTDLGLGYGYGLDVHVSHEILKPIAAGDKTLPLSFGGCADVSFKCGINISADARVSWHYTLGIPQLDLYFGPSIGFKYLWIANPYEWKPWGAMDWGGNAGLRWAFKDSMAAFVEFGYTGLTYAKVGVTFIK